MISTSRLTQWYQL